LIVAIDTKSEELAKEKTCTALIVTKNFVNDFLYISDEGNFLLCEQVKYSRIILIKPNMFNKDSPQEIQNKLSAYISMFNFEDSVSKKISVHMISDNSTEKFLVYEDKKIHIRDMVETGTKDIYRQLFFVDNMNVIQSEVKLKLTSKSKAIQEKLIILPTIDKYKQKNLVTCLNLEYICNFYQKCIISGFFLTKNNIPKEKINVLILGAGIGSLGVYIKEIFKDNVIIDSVEIEKDFKEIGEKFFGMHDFEGNKWYFEDALANIETQIKSNKAYDIIINDINNFNSNEGISPPNIFFKSNFLDNIKSLLKVNGIYIINFITRSNNKFQEIFSILKEKFSKVLYVENNDELNKIYYLLKLEEQLDNVNT